MNEHPLKKVPGRKQFVSKIQRMFRKKPEQTHAIVFFDIDNFHVAYTRLAAEEQRDLIFQIAKRISLSLSSKDFLAYQGNDKFLFCIADIHTRQKLISKLDEIIASFRGPFEIYQQKIYLTASLGVALFPEDEKKPEHLLQYAHDAWYSAKKTGKNNYQLYAEKNRMRSHDDIEKQLYFALSRNEFSLAFQPQFDTVCGVMVGAEALLRWNNPEIGSISPLDFIPIAEKTGLIFPISDWVIREACRQLRSLPAHKKNFRLCINLSAKEFQSPSSLIERLHHILEEEHINASCFELELTETNIMENYAIATPILHNLKKEGFHIACDDFGIGYSSLNRLKHLPVDTLKIDKSFVDRVADDEYDHAIIQAILLIAKIFKFRVVAEGIEASSQIETLRKLGCNLIQGYYFSKPTSIKRISQMLNG
jgi:diguanylate cyclase (GGDEF)-like protein